MNETFGIAEDRYKATDAQKKQIDAKKKEIMDKAREIGELDKILDCEELAPYISPAWREPQSREQMVIRKMRNNVVKKIPKDFGSAIAAEQYHLMDDTYKEIHAEIEENANSVVFDAEYKEAEETKQIQEKAPEQPQEQPTEPEKAEEPQEVQPTTETPQNEAVSETEQPQFDMPDWMQ
jgi:hypothetical protein